MPKQKTTINAKKKEKEDNTGFFIPGGLLLGMGVGFAFDNLVAGLFIGLGTGMVVFAIINFVRK